MMNECDDFVHGCFFPLFFSTIPAGEFLPLRSSAPAPESIRPMGFKGSDFCLSPCFRVASAVGAEEGVPRRERLKSVRQQLPLIRVNLHWDRALLLGFEECHQDIPGED